MLYVHGIHGGSGPADLREDDPVKVIRATHLGMCFGVRDAISLAVNQAGPLTILGELVHNETVMRRLRRRGIHTAAEPDAVTTPTVMVTAHGASNHRLAEVRSRGLSVLEATCPLVHLAHRAVEELVRAGCHLVIIGQRNHVEVRGIVEDLEEFDVILSDQDVTQLRERPKFGVAAQTTQPVERVRHLTALIRHRFPRSEVHLKDTVCQPTKLRQHAAAELSHQCDVIVVVGGVNSNNTRELVATCRQHCDRVHHIQKASDVDPRWFVDATLVGLTAGTSTPDDLIDEVEHRLRAIASIRSVGSSQPSSNHSKPNADYDIRSRLSEH